MENNTLIGENAGALLIKANNCCFIGTDAGADIIEGEGLVIVGNGIRSLDHSQENVIFFGDKVAISRDVFENILPQFKLIEE